MLLCADGLANVHGGAHGKAYDYNRQHVHDLGTEGDSSSAGNSFKLSDDEKVSHAIKSL